MGRSAGIRGDVVVCDVRELGERGDGEVLGHRVGELEPRRHPVKRESAIEDEVGDRESAVVDVLVHGSREWCVEVGEGDLRVENERGGGLERLAEFA